MTRSVITVRLASVEEASLVREVMLAAYDELRGALPVDSSAYGETIEDVLDKMRIGGAVVAEDSRDAVGSAQFTPDGEYLYVGRVAVLPSHRRRGVATAMMRHIETIARERGHHAVRVGVRDSLPGNVALYASLDYQVVTIDPHPRGPDRVVMMVKHVARRD